MGKKKLKDNKYYNEINNYMESRIQNMQQNITPTVNTQTNNVENNNVNKSPRWNNVLKRANEIMNSDMMKNVNKNVQRSSIASINPIQTIINTGTDLTRNVYNKMTTEEQRKQIKNNVKNKTIDILLPMADKINSTESAVKNKLNEVMRKNNTGKTNNVVTDIEGNKKRVLKLQEIEEEIRVARNELNNDKVLKLKSEQSRLEKEILENTAEEDKTALQKITKKSEAFEDGYQFGDISKTAISTGFNIGSNIIGGISDIGQSVSQLGGYGYYYLLKSQGKDDVAKKWLEATQKAQEDYQNMKQGILDITQKDSILGDTGEQVASSVGQSLAFGSAGKIGGNLLTFASGASAQLDNSYKQEDVEDWQAILRGVAGGAVSTFSENIFDNFGFGGTGLSDTLKSTITSKFESGISKALARTFVSGLGEASEEFIEAFGNWLTDTGVNCLTDAIGHGAKFDENSNWDGIGESLLVGFLSGGLGEITSTNANVNAKTSATVNQIQQDTNSKLSKKEINKIKNEQLYNYETSLENENLVDREKFSKNKKENEKIKNKLKEKVENEYLSNEETKKLIENEKTGKYKLEQINKENMQENETLQNSNINKIQLPISRKEFAHKENIKNEEKVLQKDKYKNDSNAKAFFDSAVNSEIDVSNEKIEALYDLPNKRGIKVEFNEELFKDVDGKIKENINAVYVTDANGKRSITYNPKANQETIIEKNAIHEITHDLEGTNEYKKLSQMVLEKMEGTAEFEEAYNSLKETYSKVKDSEGRILYNTNSEEFDNMIKQEAVADYLGENLGNQEYINGLVNGKESRNIAQKIYDTIVSFLDKITGYKSEEAYLRKVKSMFESAFNTEYKIDNKDKMKYHISENFSKEIDESLNGNISSNNQIKARDYTPSILVENGVEDLPMLLTQKHLRQIIYTKEQAENLGYNISLKDHYHGLGKEKLLKAIDNLDNPKEIYKQSDSNYLIITEMKDNNGNQIIVPIQINGTGTYNNIDILENQIASVYGRKNLEKYIKDNSFEKIYEKNRSNDNNEGVKSHDTIDTSINSIPSSKKDVNTTKYSMQEQENNTGKWQNFLEKNTINEGTRTTLGEIKLPQKKKIKLPQNLSKSDAINMPIDKILQYKTDGGYRTEGQINELYKDIKKNGIVNPIELIRDEDGKIKINNGNHRLEIAEQLGLKEVPVTYKDYADIDKIDKSIYDANDKDLLNYVEDYKNGNNGNSKKVSSINGRSGTEQEYDSSNRIKSEDEGTAGRNDKIRGETQGIYNRPSSITTSTKDTIQELDNNASSFSIDKNITDEVYREEISEGKTRKHYKTVYESDNVGKTGKEVAKELYKIDTYTPVSNASTVSEVNDYINKVGNDNAYSAFTTKIYDKSQRITLNDIAIGERLIQKYSQTGDYVKVNELIQDVAVLGTELGQQVQALSLVKKASPEGQLSLLNKIVDRTNTKNNTDLKITDEMAEKILKSKNEKELQDNVSLVAEEIANKMELTVNDKMRSWRYLSMLGNPRTHVRNLTANVFMNVVQNTKNKVSGGIQDVAKALNPDYQPTQTIKLANKESVEFAKLDAEVMVDQIDGGGKYDIQNIIENSKRQFNNEFLNWIAEKNSNLLEVEDKIFLKKAYRQAMQEYMTARKLKLSEMKGKVLEKARQYACLQAQEATFHQYNELASKLSQIESKGGVLGKAVSAILPFKKTPMNIAKEGIEYSPIGLLTTTGNMIKEINNINTDLKAKLKNKKITQVQYNEEISNKINKVIDGYAKGLTGSGIAILGYFLTQMGVLKAGNNGDDDEFEEELGKQTYSIQIGDNTYSLDWVAPAGIPLFIGSSLYQAMNNMEETDDISNILNNVATATVNSLEPMTEMSMLSSLTDLMTSYSQGNEVISEKVASTINSYMGQFVPTALSQVAKLTDTKVRSTTSTKTGFSKYVDQFLKQTQAKIPVLSQKLPVKKDIWGNDVERAENPIQRTLETAILPYDRKKVIDDMTNEALKDVFNETGEKSILPTRPQKTITIDGKKYRYDAKEYNQAQEQLGKTSKKLLNDLVMSNSYSKMTYSQKVDAISEIYKYSKELVKKNYADDNDILIETSDLYNIVSRLEKNNKKTSSYFEFKAKTDDMKKQSEKLECLAEMKMNNQTKRIIYEDSIGNDDELYGVLSKLQDGETNINAYLDYKLQEFKSDEDEKSNIEGKTVSKGRGTAKNKKLNYIYNSNMTYIEKAYLIETNYADTLDIEQREEIYNLVTEKITDEEKLEKILKKFKDLEKHKSDGKWYWKK